MARWLAVVVLVVAALAAVALYFHSERTRESLRAAQEAAADRAAAAAATEIARARAASAPTMANGADETRTSEQLARDASDDARLARVTGRFLDRSGAPIEGVRVVSATQPQGIIGIDSRVVAESDGALVLSDVAGRFAWTAPAPPWKDSTCFLAATKRGYARLTMATTVNAGAVSALGDLTLEPGGDLSGTVVDAAGSPAAGAKLSVTAGGFDPAEESNAMRFGPRRLEIRAATAAQDGAFAFDGIPVGTWRVWASRDEKERGGSSDLNVAAGSSLDDIRIVLAPSAPDASIEGIVVLPDGTPCAHARIEARSTGGGTTMFAAGGDGRFQLMAFTSGTWTLEAQDLDGRCEAAREAGVAAGAREVVLQLREARRFVVELKSDGGAPIEKAQVEIDDPKAPRAVRDSGWRALPGGRAELTAPPAPFALNVEAPDHAPARVGPLDPKALPEVVPVTLRRIPGIDGRVTFHGAPVEGARVVIHVAFERARRGGFPSRTVDAYDFMPASTDAKGAFHLSCAKAMALAYVRAEKAGLSPGEAGPLAYDPERGLKDVEVVLTEGGAIEGRVIVGPDQDPAGILVGVSRGDGYPKDTRSAAEGAFRFEGLTPGRYDVRALDESSFGASWRHSGEAQTEPEIPWVCVVEEGKTTRYDLDLRARAKRLVGSARLGAFVPSGFEATITRDASRDAAPSPVVARLDADGTFAADLEKGGDYAIDVKGTHPSVAPLEIRDSVFVFESGETRWKFAPKTGRAEGTCPLEADGTKPMLNFRSGTSFPFVYGTIPVAADGAFTLDPIPAGPLRLRRNVGSVEKGTIEVQVPAGGSVQVSVP